MKSRVAREFWKQFHELPPEIQRLAYKNYWLWQNDPQHPSLRFKPIGSKRWSARIGEHYRAVGRFVESDTFLWIWIGTHENYNKL